MNNIKKEKKRENKENRNIWIQKELVDKRNSIEEK